MNAMHWAQEDIETLHEMVLESLCEGKGREEAFKRFARKKGLKSINAVRYKWITTSPSTAELTLRVADIQQKMMQRKRVSETVHEPASYRTGSPSEAEAANDNEQLRMELTRVKSIISRLRAKNNRLRRENRTLMQNLLSTHTHPSVEQPQVVVVVADGWKPENLATFIQHAHARHERVALVRPDSV